MTQKEKYWINKVWEYTKEELDNRYVYLMLKQIYVVSNNRVQYNFYITKTEIEEIKAFNTMGDFFSLDKFNQFFTDEAIANGVFQKWVDFNPYLTPKMKTLVESFQNDKSYLIYFKPIQNGKVIPFSKELNYFGYGDEISNQIAEAVSQIIDQQILNAVKEIAINPIIADEIENIWNDERRN